MKRYLLCFCLMMKRMLKKPAFLLFLFILPILSVLITRLEQDTNERVGIMVGILLEGEAEGERKGELEGELDRKSEGGIENGVYEQQGWNERFLSLLTESDSVIQFRVYEDQSVLMREIQKGELDCGVVLPAEIWEKLMPGAASGEASGNRFDMDEWRDSITIYETSTSSMTEIVKERIAAALFTLYSEKSYVNYVEQAEALSGTRENKDGNGSNGSIGRVDTEEITSFAYEAYESHLMDGSTFAFVYNGESNDYGEGESTGMVGTATDNMEAVDVETDSAEEDSTKTGRQQPMGQPGFRLRGILAVCIFLSGLCGLLTDWRDRQDGCFVQIMPGTVTTVVNVWIPTIYTSAAVLLSYALTGELAGIGQEFWRLLWYQLLIVVYCCIIRLFLRKQETIAAAIPILTLVCMVCCPVWIRLASYLSIFRVLEKLFPVTYYLI